MKRFETKRILSGSRVFWFLLACLAALLGFAVLWDVGAFESMTHHYFILFLHIHPAAFLIAAIFGGGHFLCLMVLASRVTTRTARWVLFLYVFVLLVLVHFGMLAFNIKSLRDLLSQIGFGMPVMLLMSLAGLIPLLIVLPGLFVYSMPGRTFAWIPLLIQYTALAFIFGFADTGSMPQAKTVVLVLFIPLMAVSGYYFPKHRRILEYWRPSPLPRIGKRKDKAPLNPQPAGEAAQP